MLKKIKYLQFFIYIFFASCQVNSSTSDIIQNTTPELITPTIQITLTPTTNSSIVLQVPEESTPTSPKPTSTPAINSDILDLGILVFSHPNIYAWHKMQIYKTSNEIILNKDEIQLQYPPQLNTPVQEYIGLKFSHYSNQIAFTTWTTPTLWLSDITYQNPQPILHDIGEITLNWSPNDSLLFLSNEKEQQVYHLKTGKFENWYWDCESVGFSEVSKKLAPVCSKNINAPSDEKMYAILEWEGEINYYDQLSSPFFLQADSQGITFWQWSKNGDYLAFFNPDDIEGHLYIANAKGDILQKIPGLSIFNKHENQEVTFSQSFLDSDTSLFIWSQDSSILLVKSYGQSEGKCPPYTTSLDPSLIVNMWPCWQAVDVKTGEIIWSEGEWKNTPIPTNIVTEDPVYINHIALSPNGRFVAIYTSYPYDILLVDLFNNHTLLLPYSFPSLFNLYWGNP